MQCVKISTQMVYGLILNPLLSCLMGICNQTRGHSKKLRNCERVRNMRLGKWMDWIGRKGNRGVKYHRAY